MTSARRTTTTAQRVAAVVVGVLVAVPLALVALLATAGPAQASTYRYWTYWWGSDTGKSSAGWTFAKVGPAGHAVGDGWVLGWRFATSTVAGGKPPRAGASYSDLCQDRAPTDGSVRVALVLDYGTGADAPPDEQPPRSGSVQLACLVLPAGSTGATALRKANVSVRQNSDGLICDLNGYPKRECAPVVPDPTPTPTPTPRATAATPRATSSTASGGAPTSRSPASPSSSRAPASPTPLATTGGSAAASSAATTGVSGSASSPSGSADPGEAVLPAVAGAPAQDAQGSGSPVGLVVGGVVVAAIAGSAWWTSRRRRLG